MGVEGGGRVKAKVLILGIDGYIGWPLANHLKGLGYEVIGVDNCSRRVWVEELGSDSLIPISHFSERLSKFTIDSLDLENLGSLPSDLSAIVHLAEQPSAAWSMKSDYNACETQSYNILGTLNLLWLMKRDCPEAHLIKLGTMGEYGTPDCVIPEGFIESGEMKGLMFPRKPGSFYHLSKTFDSMNIEFACRTWGLRSTDIMQGVVFGHIPGTRFDYDECFGTVFNRFCVQAVAGMPLTVYGKGGQTRGYLPLADSIECLTLALKNPPENGEYRVFNQFARTYSVNEIAEIVQKVHPCEVSHIPNPRKEAESHFYQPKHEKLRDLGYNPTWDVYEQTENIIKSIKPYKDDIRQEVINPVIKW